MTLPTPDPSLTGLGIRHGAGQGQLMLCLISLDGQAYALRTSAVREVIGNAVIVAVPLAAPFIAGIVNHRGVMLTTVSLRRVLGLDPAVGKSCVIVVRAGCEDGESFGLLVDELAGVLTLDGGMVEAIPPSVAENIQRLFRGMHLREPGPLVELDADHLRPEWLAAPECCGN